MFLPPSKNYFATSSNDPATNLGLAPYALRRGVVPKTVEAQGHIMPPYTQSRPYLFVIHKNASPRNVPRLDPNPRDPYGQHQHEIRAHVTIHLANIFVRRAALREPQAVFCDATKRALFI